MRQRYPPPGCLPDYNRRRKIRAAPARRARAREWSARASSAGCILGRSGKRRACHQSSPARGPRNCGNLRRALIVELACVLPGCNKRRLAGRSSWPVPTASVIALMAMTLRRTSEFFGRRTRLIDYSMSRRGWIMATISKSRGPSDRTSRGNAGRTVLQLCAVMVVVFTVNVVLSLRAAPSSPGLMPAPERTSQASSIDRSLKGDRATFVAPAMKAAIPPGCEPPFSALVKPARANSVARCLT